MKRFLELPINITAIKFDLSGCYPSRLDFDGKSIHTVRFNDHLVSFCVDNTYFWLEKTRASWRLTKSPESLASK
jgi:hypothetical protein